MTTKNFLNKFEYSMVPSEPLASLAKTARQSVTGHPPLMRVKINFKDGRLLLEGDWHFMMASNRYAEPDWFSLHAGRVGIETDIYPASGIDLDDWSNDGSVFAVKGIIKDGSNLEYCSGLIILDAIKTNTGLINHKWNISFYLYDHLFENWEIKFKLPVYTTSGFQNN